MNQSDKKQEALPANVPANTNINKKNKKTAGGKRAHMIYMFKSPDRRRTLFKVNSVMRFFYSIALAAAILAVAAALGAFVLWLISIIFATVFTFGLIWLNSGFSDYLESLLTFAGKSAAFAPYAFIAFAVVYLVKFIIEWLFILHESHELKGDRENNRNYIAVAGAVKRVKLFGLFMTLTAVGMLVAVSYLLSGGEVENSQKVTVIIFFAVVLIALLANRIFSVRQFRKVYPNVTAIQAERTAMHLAHAEPGKCGFCGNKIGPMSVYCGKCGTKLK